MPKSTMLTTVKDAAAVPYFSPPAPKKRAAMEISKGKRPLHGMKLLVRIAIIRSRGESMIRAAITPAALQPKPMAMVSACLPWAPHRLKILSRLKATLGR